MTAQRTWSGKSAPRRDHRICRGMLMLWRANKLNRRLSTGLPKRFEGFEFASYSSVLHGWAGWRREGAVPAFGSRFMPHKANAARRHHIPRPKRRVTNWSEYNTLSA